MLVRDLTSANQTTAHPHGAGLALARDSTSAVGFKVGTEFDGLDVGAGLDIGQPDDSSA